MNKIILAVIAIVVVIAGVILFKGPAQTTTPVVQITPKETTIIITKSGFEPKTITIKIGTKVIWKNDSGDLTNVSSAVHPTHQVYPPLNLDNIVAGQTVSLVFDKAGTYNYHNHLDAAQEGVVEVIE